MFIATSTNLVSDLTEVTGGLFVSIYPYILVVIGFCVTFWVIDILLSIIPNNNKFRDDTEDDWYIKKESEDAQDRLDRIYKKNMDKPFKWTTKD